MKTCCPGVRKERHPCPPTTAWELPGSWVAAGYPTCPRLSKLSGEEASSRPCRTEGQRADASEAITPHPGRGNSASLAARAPSCPEGPALCVKKGTHGSPLSPGPADAQKHTHGHTHGPSPFLPLGPDHDSRIPVTAVRMLLGPQQWFSQGSLALQACVATSGNILIVRAWPGWVLLASAEHPVMFGGASTTKNPLPQMSGALRLTNQRPAPSLPLSVCREVWWVRSLTRRRALKSRRDSPSGPGCSLL